MTMIGSAAQTTVKAIPLFARIPRRRRKQIARWADEVQVPAGSTLIEEGAYAREFCVIVSGSAELRQHGRRIGQLGAGDSFGAAGLLDLAQTQAETVVTTSDTRLLVMGPREFAAMTWRFPVVAERLEAAIVGTDPLERDRVELTPNLGLSATSRRAKRRLRQEEPSQAGTPRVA
jgi:CRP-like cAMP-binding protein